MADLRPGMLRVLRGGAWPVQPHSLRVAKRIKDVPTVIAKSTFSFRCASDHSSGSSGG